MKPRPRDVVYRVDAGENLIWVGGGWDAFAAENAAPGLAGESVLGQSLWRFVDGIEARHLYEMLFEKVRREGAAMVVPFRCDSPDMRRYMELRIGRGSPSGGDLELIASLLRAEPRAAVPLLDPAQKRSGSTLGICSFCKRIEVMNGGWIEVDEAVSRLELMAVTPLPRLSHGVCPDCTGRAHELLSAGR